MKDVFAITGILSCLFGVAYLVYCRGYDKGQDDAINAIIQLQLPKVETQTFNFKQSA